MHETSFDNFKVYGLELVEIFLHKMNCVHNLFIQDY